MLLHPIEKEILGKTFILSKFPATAGREISLKYAQSGFPNITDYAGNESTMFKLMAFVAVPVQGGNPMQLTTQALIDNHVDNWEMLVGIEREMMEYNRGPLAKG